MSIQAATASVRQGLLASTIVAVAVGAAPAAAVAQAGGSAESTTVEDVVVTAQKREERIIDVPIAISSVSQQQLQNQTLVTLSDLGARLPNVLATGSSLFPNFTIRGVSSQSGGSPGFAPAVGVYVDEVFQGRDRAFNVPFDGVARVEVLRGPQGTLYGKNTIGGTINVITQKPTDEFKGEAAVLYGNLDFNQETLTVSGPIVPGKVTALVSGLHKSRDGYIENRFTGKDINSYDGYGGRARVIVTPVDGLTLDFSADYYQQEGSEALQTVSYVPLPFPPFNAQPQPDPKKRKVDLDAPIAGERKVCGGAARADYELPFARLTAIAAYRKDTSSFQDASDGLRLDEFSVGRAEDGVISSQEVRLTSTAPGPFSWIAGAYFYQEKVNSLYNIQLGSQFPSPLFGLPPLPANFRETALQAAVINEKSYAAFGSITYDLSDSLRLQGGLRYTHEKKNLFYAQVHPRVTNGLIYAFALPVPPRTDDLSEGVWTGDLSLSYKFTPNQVGYVKYSRGYKAGGFQADVISPPPNTPPASFDFAPEYVNNYEAGLKGRWLDGRLSVNTAVFYLDYSNKQERVNTGISFLISNAGEARVKGAEVEFAALPLAGLEITGSVGVLDAKYTSFKNAGGLGIDFDGNRLTGAPRLTGTLAAQYERPLTDKLSGVVRGELIHMDYIYTDTANSRDLRQRVNTQLNARVGVQTDRWGLYLWGKNLTDELILGGGTKVITVTARGVNVGRTYGLEARARF
ncbi:MAG: TonB-dependent receptor [Phenylobacterium sp.]|nr:TonB-dependent receptor [Phenylobacterium sp.]